MISRVFLFVAVIALIWSSGCTRKNYNQVPKASSKTGVVYNKKPSQTGSTEAYGPVRFPGQEAAPDMVFVEGGTFHMGGAEGDVGFEYSNRERQVTVHSFYLDQTEVSNDNWKEFLHYYEIDSGADKVVQMRPDTFVWYRDLAYNEPFVELYFQHPAFNAYPVVGVSWYQANEYCKWRTNFVNRNLQEADPDAIPHPRFRLPTEAEWEYAARGLLEQELYPWEGKSLRNQKGRFNANLKRGRGDYAGRSSAGGSRLLEGLNDGYMIPGPVMSFYDVNDFGLYHMAGNVAEWTLDAYRVLAYEDNEDFQPFRRRGDVADDPQQVDVRYAENGKTGESNISLLFNPYNPDKPAHRFNPAADPRDSQHDRVKVYRGGGWSDVAYYLSCGTRRFWNADSSASHIGFRCAMSRVGSPSLNY